MPRLENEVTGETNDRARRASTVAQAVPAGGPSTEQLESVLGTNSASLFDDDAEVNSISEVKKRIILK